MEAVIGASVCASLGIWHFLCRSGDSSKLSSDAKCIASCKVTSWFEMAWFDSGGGGKGREGGGERRDMG